MNDAIAEPGSRYEGFTEWDAGEFIRELSGAYRKPLIDRRVQRSELVRRHLVH